MDDELKPTLFDEQLQSKELQILKTSIPYLQEPQQKNLAIFAKILELQKTIHFFENDSSSLNICSMENPEENVVNMLNDIHTATKKRRKILIPLSICSSSFPHTTYYSADQEVSNGHFRFIKTGKYGKYFP